MWKPRKFSPAARYNNNNTIEYCIDVCKKISRPKGAKKSEQNLSYFKILKKNTGNKNDHTYCIRVIWSICIKMSPPTHPVVAVGKGGNHTLDSGKRRMSTPPTIIKIV